MEWDLEWGTLYALLAIASIAPYVIEAATSWLIGIRRHRGRKNAHI